MSDDLIKALQKEAREDAEIITRLRAALSAVTGERDAAERSAYEDAARFIEENVFNYSSTENNYWSKRKGGDSNGLEYAREFRARAALEGVTEPASPWRDIESAPKDGTEIIGVLFIDYKDGLEPLRSGPWTMSWCECKWKPTWEKEFVLESESDFGATYKELDVQPTHWMPLPEPPK